MIIIKKLNNKGFMLLEVLASSVVILIMFVTIYETLLPTIGEYEKRDNYADISTVYDTFYVRKIFLQEYNSENISLNNGYLTLYNGECNINESLKDKCNTYLEALNISEVILTKHNLKELSYEGDLSSYLKYLQGTIKEEENELYRIIVKTKDNLYSNSTFLVEQNINNEEINSPLTNEMEEL